MMSSGRDIASGYIIPMGVMPSTQGRVGRTGLRNTWRNFIRYRKFIIADVKW